jgi:hypothetical protein
VFFVVLVVLISMCIMDWMRRGSGKGAQADKSVRLNSKVLLDGNLRKLHFRPFGLLRRARACFGGVSGLPLPERRRDDANITLLGIFSLLLPRGFINL